MSPKFIIITYDNSQRKSEDNFRLVPLVVGIVGWVSWGSTLNYGALLTVYQIDLTKRIVVVIAGCWLPLAGCWLEAFYTLNPLPSHNHSLCHSLPEMGACLLRVYFKHP